MNYLNTYRKLSHTFFFALVLCLFPYRWGLADNHGEASVMTDDIEFFCDQSKDNSSIKCSYRLVNPEITKQISASLGAIELPIKDISTYPYADSTTSILFLVDTSKTSSDDAFAQTREHIIALAQQALPHQQIGLASFDARLTILKPLGSDPGQIVSATNELIETEQPTELYGNILDAIKLLETSQSDRKALFLFSSGRSEDQAVYQNDVVKAALDAKVKIVTISYPSDVTNTNTDAELTNNPIDALPKDTLENLRGLSKRTGGMSITSLSNSTELPEAFLSDPFAVIDNGGTLTIDLSPAVSENLSGLQLSVLVIETLSKRITVKLPLELTVNNADNPVDLAIEDKQSTSPSPTETVTGLLDENGSSSAIAATNESIQPSAVENQQPLNQQSLPTGLFSFPFPIAWLLFPLALIIGACWFFLRNKSNSNGTTAQQGKQEEEEKAFACLVSLTDDSMYYSIENSPWTIGRTRQNDMFLEHSSVSRHHAEIKRNRDSSFTIIDLDSLNGVFVNNTKVSTGLIKENDKIDIGDMRLRFVFRSREVTSQL